MKTIQMMRHSTALGKAALGIAAALFLGLPLNAGIIPIVNASFETDVVGLGSYVVNAAGWTSSTLTGASTFHPDASQLSGGPQNGVNVLALEAGDVSQTLSATLTANTQYTLLVGVGSRSDTLPIVSYEADLVVNGSVIAYTTSPLPTNGNFITATFTYSTASGDPNIGLPLSIWLRNDDINLTQSQVLFDNVRLSSVSTAPTGTPEPSSLVLALGVAAFGLCAHRRAMRR